MIDRKYRAQVDLLLRILPYISREDIFALKGGTAINLFIRDMPRLSVDIDLTYLPFDNREVVLQKIQDGLGRIRTVLEKHIKGLKVSSVPLAEGADVKLNCQYPGAQIKIEVNSITRGHVLPVSSMPVLESVRKEFGKFAAMNIISFGELYGGKICAAMDRQHPRDLFDVRLLLDNEGITDEIWNAFLIFLLSHYKPIHELLSPILKDQQSAFKNQFRGMTNVGFSYADYTDTRKELIKTLGFRILEKDKQLLFSFASGDPDWTLQQYETVKDLPAIQWKLKNILKLKQDNPSKYGKMIESLEAVLSNY